MWIRGRGLVVLILIAGLVGAGCQVDPRPQDVAHFATNRAATQDVAAYDGVYSLYSEEGDQMPAAPLRSVRLIKGQIVGFEVGADRQAFAIAGNDRMQLQPGHYRWQMSPDEGQVDWKKTNTLVIEVVVATAAVAIIVVTTVLAVKGL